MMYEISPFVYNKPDSETSERFRFFSGMISESFRNIVWGWPTFCFIVENL